MNGYVYRLRIFYSCILSLISLFYACNNININDYKTNLLSEYLKSHNSHIPQEQHLYIIYSNMSCTGCVMIAEGVIPEYISYMNKSNTTFIISGKYSDLSDLVEKTNYIRDDKQEIEYIDLELFNISLIQTDKGKISNVFSLTTDNLSDFEDVLINAYVENGK